MRNRTIGASLTNTLINSLTSAFAALVTVTIAFLLSWQAKNHKRLETASDNFFDSTLRNTLYTGSIVSYCVRWFSSSNLDAIALYCDFPAGCSKLYKRSGYRAELNFLEAAQIDGASKIERLRYMIIPFRSTIIYAATVVFAISMGEFGGSLMREQRLSNLCRCDLQTQRQPLSSGGEISQFGVGNNYHFCCFCLSVVCSRNQREVFATLADSAEIALRTDRSADFSAELDHRSIHRSPYTRWQDLHQLKFSIIGSLRFTHPNLLAILCTCVSTASASFLKETFRTMLAVFLRLQGLSPALREYPALRRQSSPQSFWRN